MLIDNLHVAGSSIPVSDRDADGDSWQVRRLDDGVYTSFDYYWAFEYLAGGNR